MDMEDSDSPFQMKRAINTEVELTELVEGGNLEVSALNNDQSMDQMAQNRGYGID